MSKKANNTPTSIYKTIPTEITTDLVTVFDKFRRLPPIRKNQPEELRERLDYFFRTCTDNDVIPSVEALSLCVGVSRQALWKWQQEEDSECGALITRAKAVCNTVLTELALSGQCNPVFAIWMQKNNFHYSDIGLLEDSTGTERHTRTPEEIEKMYGNVSKVEDCEVKDGKAFELPPFPDLPTD